MALRSPLTQYALAVRLQLNGWDISRSGIAKIEIKLRKVTDVEILLLAKVLGVTVACGCSTKLTEVQAVRIGIIYLPLSSSLGSRANPELGSIPLGL